MALRCEAVDYSLEYALGREHLDLNKTRREEQAVDTLRLRP
jgi:hypothetical protein